MQNKDLIILAALIAAIWGGLIWQERIQTSNAELVSIKTDKTEYATADALKVAIKNNLDKKICFSSCYPYYLEKKNSGWELYSYDDCQKENISESCVLAHQEKFFQIDLSMLVAGIHRLVVPVCLNCQDKTSFEQDNTFYSNEFLIK